MNYLTVGQILRINEQVLGHPDGLRDQRLLGSAAAQPQQSAGGVDAYTDVHAKAAALMRSLARNHAFVDGNKRTALAATIVFYQLNGYHFFAADLALIQFVLDVAIGAISDIGAIAEHLRKFVLPMDFDDEPAE